MKNSYFQVNVYSHIQPPHKSVILNPVWRSKHFSSLDEAKHEAEIWKKQRVAHANVDNTGLDENEADWTVIDGISIVHIEVVEEL